jgi:hypothetical protein
MFEQWPVRGGSSDSTRIFIWRDMHSHLSFEEAFDLGTQTGPLLAGHESVVPPLAQFIPWDNGKAV